MVGRLNGRAVAVWDEFGNAEQPAEQQGHAAGAPASEAHGSQAARDWLTSLASHCEGAEGAKAKAQLVELLSCGSRSSTNVVVVANLVRQQIGKVFSWSHHMVDPPGTDNPQRARQCQYLFERVLHGVLEEALRQEGVDAAALAAAGAAAAKGIAKVAAGQDGRRSLGSSAVLAARDRVVQAVVADTEQQLGLVNACVEVVNYAYLRHPQEAFPWATLQLGRIHECLEVWQACDWITDHMSKPLQADSGSVPGIPQDVVSYLVAIQVRVEEELAFCDTSSIYRRIAGRQAWWAQLDGSGRLGPDADGGASQDADQGAAGGSSRAVEAASTSVGSDAVLLARFVASLARTAMFRTCSVCQELLTEHPHQQTICPELPQRACRVVDVLLVDHFGLLYGQHLSVAIACAIYLTVRLHGGALPFRKITALMASRLPNHDEHTFACVELPPDPEEEWGWDGRGGESGDTRAFYNRVFLPLFAGYDASDLLGADLPPTPAKAQLEAPEPAAGLATDGGLTAGGGGRSGHLLLPAAGLARAYTQLEESTPAAAGAAAGGAAEKELRKLRRPLHQVTNSGGGGAGAGGGSSRLNSGAGSGRVNGGAGSFNGRLRQRAQ